MSATVFCISNVNYADGILFLTDVTGWVLETKYEKDLIEGKIKYIMIPDFSTSLKQGLKRQNQSSNSG